MIFYDFEVFKYNWLVVLVDTDAKEETVIVDDRDKMTDFYNEHKYDIWGDTIHVTTTNTS